MADGRSAERSSIEIKDLLRKLHPERGSHKDRIRRLNKFRTYVMPSNQNLTPEFFDDDIPLLFLGAATPAIYLDEDDDLPMGLFYGLLFACGMPSESGGLKRSARHATNLVKWLLMDWREGVNTAMPDTDLNIFSKAFLSFPADFYRHMRLDLHVTGDERGGTREDACQIIVFILMRHLSEDGERSQPLMVEELLSTPQAQQAYDLWSARNSTETQQDAIKKNALARQAEIANRQRQDALAKAGGGQGPGDQFDLMEESEGEEEGEDGLDKEEVEKEKEDDKDDDSYYDPDENDVMAAIRRRQKKARKEAAKAGGGGRRNANAAIAVRWEDSQVAREQAARAASAARAGQHDTVRDSQDAAAEMAEREEEKAKLVGKDPLGILSFEEYDMRRLESNQADQMEQALQEINEEIQKAESTANEEIVKKAVSQKESLESLVERMGGLEAMESTANQQASILPTNPKFDPILFLTIMHRKTPYNTLIQSLDRLSKKTENQAEQLQNLVRDNFPLFVRCAEGFEEFRRSSEQEVGLGVNERIEKLEAIAESSAFQAAKSFKPLLDNTSEVRKVQSALSVLNRVGPILQVPAMMRQHIDNRRYSQALKTYRRALVIDETCNIELLKHVKLQSEECVKDARRDLEKRITQDNVSVEDLLHSIRDLGELLELDVAIREMTEEGANAANANQVDRTSVHFHQSQERKGIYNIGGTVIHIREHPPALACLLLQAAHFATNAKALVQTAEDMTSRIYSGESLAHVMTDLTGGTAAIVDTTKRAAGAGNQWKYDVLDARVLSTIKAVELAKTWLPRLVRIGKAAREDEKRRAARIGHKRRSTLLKQANHLTAFEVFVNNVTPSLTRLVEHAAFCALGSNTRTGAKYVEMTYGQNAEEKLRTLLRSPLPPSQSAKVGKELADLVELLDDGSIATDDLRPNNSMYKASPLEACKRLGDSAVVTIEKRRCIYAFDVCSRACSNKASGSGKFDAEALLQCLENLSEQLSRPEECSNEVEKGCELVVRRCCEGLAGYVRDRGDDARLSAVAECADIMADRVEEFIYEASKLTKNSETIHEIVMEDILGLESAMFDEYLESIRQHVADSVRVGWLDKDAADSAEGEDVNQPPSFPAYLSASLLAIARCRAQVEQCLGNRVRRTVGIPYQHLSMETVSDGVVDGICKEVMKRKLKLKVRQADRLANELEFLKNTLSKFLGDETQMLLKSTLQMVSTKAGRGRDYQDNGPDGLAALEELERLGRVYVLCLGD